MERESMEVDVVIVGAGPSGLAAAIRLMQRAQEAEQELSVVVLEKGAEVGAHILSGAVLDPKALNELIPDWADKGAPLDTPVSKDRFLFLSETGGMGVPNLALPGCFKNHGNYIVSLGNLCRWLAEQAEALGVEVYPGFAAAEVLYDDEGRVYGVATGDMGINRAGEKTDAYTPGMELHAKYTLFAEGCRGNLGKQLDAKFGLRDDADPPSYGIGLKELWEIDPSKHDKGLVVHTAGWPLDSDTYGGSFMYHWDDNLVSVGFVVGLDYKNPYLDPYREFQRYKLHPKIRSYLEGGKRIAYGARAIYAGGLQALPKLAFAGGALIGDDAGVLNAPRIKGTHTSIKSGMLAAEAAFDAIGEGRKHDELEAYAQAFDESWVRSELHEARNFKPYMKKGLTVGTLLFGIDQKLFGGRAPWTLHSTKADYECTEPKDKHKPIDYPKPDGELTFDRLTNVSFSNVNHAEDQPVHLVLSDPSVPIERNLPTYDEPAQRYCPAGVYEVVEGDDGKPRFQINAQNCVHCKTCDIKDPAQNITWVTPQGGEGPAYPNM